MRLTPDHDRHFLLRVMLPMFGLIAILLAGAMLGLVFLAGKQNRMAIDLQEQMAENALRHFSERVAGMVADYGGRDETAEHAILDFDAVWLDEHLRARRGEAFFFVIDPDDRTLFSRIGGRPADVDALTAMTPTFRQMIARWRAGLVSAAITQMFAIDGEPHIVAMSGIHAVATRNLPADNGYLIAVAYRFDPESMRELGETFVLPNLRYELGFSDDAAGTGRIRLVAQDGTMGDSLAWDPIKPGDDLMRTVAPGLALAFAVYVIFAVVILRFVSRAARMISVSEKRAQHDALTGLPNRLLLSERMRTLLAPKPDGEPQASVFYLDLDGFKAVNDTEGHAAGDAVLMGVARRLKELCRAEDTVARLGGDEFVMVLATADRQVVERRAETLLSALSSPYPYNGRTLTVGVSIGVAMAPANGLDVNGLLHKADEALYAAKASGKGVVRFYGEDTRDRRRRDPAAELTLVSSGVAAL
jgi:diguanylate cyclase (GGDEF)-like protein